MKKRLKNKFLIFCSVLILVIILMLLFIFSKYSYLIKESGIKYSIPSFSFAVMGDSRGVSTEVSTDLQIFEGYVKDKNPSLIFFTGDLTDNGNGLGTWKEYMGTLFGKTFPQYGNHDSSSLANWLSAFRAQDAAFQNLLALGAQNYSELAGYEKRTYSFDYQNVHFISLSIISTSLAQDQKIWLENDLMNNYKEHNFVFFHVPLYSMDGHSPINDADRNFMLNLFFDYGVEAVFVGHEHLYGKYIIDGTQFGHPGKQIYQFISGSTGAPLYDCKSGLPAGSICEKTENYETVNIDGPRITVKAYRSSNSEIETVYIPSFLNSANCSYGSNDIPGTMYAGENRTVFIDFLNNGINSPWDSTLNNPYKLGSQQPQDNFIWGINRVGMVCNVDLSLCPSTSPVTLKPENNVPGATGWYRFWFNITAPQTPGNYSSYWKMVQDGVEWFGETCGKNVNVVQVPASPSPTPSNPQLNDDSHCGSNSIPTQMISGETKTIFIDLLNNGTTQWDSTLSVNPYRLGAFANNNRWGLIRVKTVCTQANPSQCSWQNAVLLTPSNHLPEPNVKYYRFYFNITAPQVNATTNFSSYWRMIQENVKWFGSICGKNITVLAIATQDTTPPQITVNNPQNTVYSRNFVIFNISLNENGDSCKYTLNNWVNSIRMNKETNMRFSYINLSIREGSYTAKFSCNDTRGNINNTTSISFSINLTANRCANVVCGSNAYCNSSAGNCVCNSAYKDCNNNISNGCEVLKTANCPECFSNTTRECLTNQNCHGNQTCVNSSWSSQCILNNNICTPYLNYTCHPVFDNQECSLINGTKMCDSCGAGFFNCTTNLTCCPNTNKSCTNSQGCNGIKICNSNGVWGECQTNCSANPTPTLAATATPSPASEQFECANNESCSENQYCKRGKCFNLTCNEFVNHVCVKKEYPMSKTLIYFFILLIILALIFVVFLLIWKASKKMKIKENLSANARQNKPVFNQNQFSAFRT